MSASAVVRLGTRTPDRTRPRWRSVALPAEHGGWSLTLEPVLLGLLVAWSWRGLLLGVAAMVAFLSRTPLKVVLVDRWRGRWLDRTRLAVRVAAVEVATLIVLVLAVAIGARGWFWVPLVVAAPLVAIELWFDMRSRSRRLLPELAGTTGIGSVAAAIALVGGRPAGLAIGLWCVVAARSAGAIPSVRTLILRARGRAAPRWHSDVAQAASVAAVGVAWLADLLPGAALAVVSAGAIVNLMLIRSRPPRPAVIGVIQMMVGLSVVFVTAAAVPPA